MTNIRVTIMIDGEIGGRSVRDVFVQRWRGKDEVYRLILMLLKWGIVWPKFLPRFKD